MNGKAILGWFKKRWAVVVCLLLAVVPPGVAFYFSSGWNKQIRDDQTKQATTHKQKLESAKVTYTLPSLSPDVQPISLKMEPNAAATEWFKQKSETIKADSSKVMDLSLQFNQGGAPRKPLVDDLFPRPANRQETISRTVEFAKVLIGDRQRTGAYQKLLADLNAGGPVEDARLAADLGEEKTRAIESIKGPNQNRELKPEEKDAITKKLIQRRIGMYQSRASQVSIYGSLINFTRRIPRQVPPRPPTVARCFAWQADYWAISDALQAIKKANTPQGASRPTTVDKAVVKRLKTVSFTLPYLTLAEEGESQGNQLPSGLPGPDGQPAPPPEPGNDGTAALFTPNYALSVSGRLGGSDYKNAMYDTIYLDLRLIVSSARLPELIDAFAQTNFMTVVDVDLAEVDLWEDLAAGYYYGPEHVVEAHLEVELVWLRSWTTPFMPRAVKKELSIPIPPPAPDAPPEEPEEDMAGPSTESGSAPGSPRDRR